MAHLSEEGLRQTKSLYCSDQMFLLKSLVDAFLEMLHGFF